MNIKLEICSFQACSYAECRSQFFRDELIQTWITMNPNIPNDATWAHTAFKN